MTKVDRMRRIMRMKRMSLGAAGFRAATSPDDAFGYTPGTLPGEGAGVLGS
jgi:hypothetical protein